MLRWEKKNITRQFQVFHVPVCSIVGPFASVLVWAVGLGFDIDLLPPRLPLACFAPSPQPLYIYPSRQPI